MRLTIEKDGKLHMAIRRVYRAMPYWELCKIDADGVRLDGRLYTFHREAGWIVVKHGDRVVGRAASLALMTDEWARDVFKPSKCYA